MLFVPYEISLSKEVVGGRSIRILNNGLMILCRYLRVLGCVEVFWTSN
jgi:hypothetical protein